MTKFIYCKKYNLKTSKTYQKNKFFNEQRLKIWRNNKIPMFISKKK